MGLGLRDAAASSDYFHPVASEEERASPRVSSRAGECSALGPNDLHLAAADTHDNRPEAVCNSARESSRDSDGNQRPVTSRKKRGEPSLGDPLENIHPHCLPFEVPIGGPLCRLVEPLEGQAAKLSWAESDSSTGSTCPIISEKKQKRTLHRPRDMPQRIPIFYQATSHPTHIAIAASQQELPLKQDGEKGAPNCGTHEHLYQNM